MTLFRTAFLLTALALAATPLSAQQNGTYTTGMGYTIEVSFNGDSLEVYEPSNGKRSVYTLQSDGTYLFTNPVNGISYTMEVGDGDTLIANTPMQVTISQGRRVRTSNRTLLFMVSHGPGALPRRRRIVPTHSFSINSLRSLLKVK